MNKQKALDVFLLAMALIIILINAVSFESRKEGLFLDEKATFHIANASYTSVGDFWNRLSDDDFRILKTIWGTLDNAPMVVGERYSLSEVKSMLDAQEGDKFTVMGTLLLSWPDSHPPFYYLLFNAFNSLIPGVSPMHVGFIINILALLLTCIILYKIVFYLTKDGICSVLGVLFYGLSFDFINSVMYIRMYALLTFWIVLLVYLYLSMVEKHFQLDGKLLLKTCVVEFFAMLTQFYAAIFIFPLFCITVAFLLVHKKTVKNYLLCQIITAVIYLLVWPASIYQVLFNGRSEDIRNNAASFVFFSRIRSFSAILRNSIFAGSKKVMLLVAALLVAYGLFRFVKEIRNGFRKFLVSDRFVLSAYLVVPAAFFYIVSAYISPWVVDRYVMPAIPFICAIVVIVFWNGAGIFVRNRYLCAALIAVFISLIYVRSFRLSPNYAFPITAEKTEFANAYQSYDALMIDPVSDSEYLEVVADIEHPFWTLIKDDHISDYLEDDFEKNIDHVVYINQFCDEGVILQDFENANCPLTSCGYSTDFFDVYEYTAR